MRRTGIKYVKGASLYGKGTAGVEQLGRSRHEHVGRRNLDRISNEYPGESSPLCCPGQPVRTLPSVDQLLHTPGGGTNSSDFMARLAGDISHCTVRTNENF